MSNTDRAWFKASPHTNYRLRRAGAGELEEIVIRMHPNAATELAAAGGLPSVSEQGLEYQVLVIKLPRMQMVRMLVVRETDDKQDEFRITSGIAFTIGDMLPIEKLRI